jgi:SAM-dependent methyltransferase
MEVACMKTHKPEQRASLKPGEEFEYYTGAIYWNNFEIVQFYINQAISGDRLKNWSQHVGDSHGCFETALFVNCGNGWVERDLFREGLIQSAVGFDVSETLIDVAKVEATKIGMPFVYMIEDANHIDLSDIEVGLVVNYGAMHHVAYIDRLTRQLCKALAKGGVYVAFDYTGLHRNQYSWAAWSSTVELNASLPERFTTTLAYPHLKTMLRTDPTEAIHSELQVEVLRRYFDLKQFVPLGGALAYQILYQNTRLYKERQTPEGIETLQRIMDADRAFLAADPESSLFSFWVATPKADALDNRLALAEWEKEENLREEAAANNSGRYYRETALELIYNEIADLRYRLSLQSS